MTMEKNLTTKPKHSKYFYFVCFVGAFVLFSTPIAYIVNKEVREYKPFDASEVSNTEVKVEGTVPEGKTVKEFLEENNPDNTQMKVFDIPEAQKNNQDASLPKRVFDGYQSADKKELYEKRFQAAKDMEDYLRGMPLNEEGRKILNRKLIQVGIEIQPKTNKVIVLPKARWRELFLTLKPEEIVNIHDPKLVKKMQEYEEQMRNFEAQNGDTDGYQEKVLKNNIRRHYAPQIKTSSLDLAKEKALKESFEQAAEANEEEEEEDLGAWTISEDTQKAPPREQTLFEKKVKARAHKINNYFAYTFGRAVNHHRNGKRKTIVNSYVDDTIKYYKHKVRTDR